MYILNYIYHILPKYISLSFASNPNSNATNVRDGERPLSGADKHAAVKHRHNKFPSYFLAVDLIFLSLPSLSIGKNK